MGETVVDDNNLQIFKFSAIRLAEEIGELCRKALKTYPNDNLINLICRGNYETLQALEEIENSEHIRQTQLNDAISRITFLEKKIASNEKLHREIQREYESAEENWHSEAKQLKSHIQELSDDNRRLHATITEKEENTVIESIEPPLEVQKLQELNQQYRDQLSIKENELNKKSESIEKMQLKIEKLSTGKEDLLHANSSLKEQITTFVHRTSDMEARLKCKDKELEDIKLMLKKTIQANEDMYEQERHSSESKSLTDMNDATELKMTLEELTKLLSEKNYYKSSCCELYNRVLFLMSHFNESELSALSLYDECADAPVQGPINKEPEDKLHPERKKGGIRRFFKFLL